MEDRLERIVTVAGEAIEAHGETLDTDCYFITVFGEAADKDKFDVCSVWEGWKRNRNMIADIVTLLHSLISDYGTHMQKSLIEQLYAVSIKKRR